MCISKEKFAELVELYPNANRILKFRSYIRRKYFKEVKEQVIKD